MAKFAELTRSDGRRVLVNPDHVTTFFDADGRGSLLILTAHAYPLQVSEAPDEVLQRLCFPVMPENVDCSDIPEAGAEWFARAVRQASPAVRDLLAEIQAFRTKTEDAEHTDTGEAWELIDNIEDALKAMR